MEIIRRPESRRTKIIHSNASSNSKMSSKNACDSSDSDGFDSDSDLKTQELEIKVKERRRILKRGRRSGKYITTANDSYDNNKTSSLSKIQKNGGNSTHRSRRRIALLGATQKISDHEGQAGILPTPGKTLQFDSNVLLAASDPKKMRKVRHIKSATQVDKPQTGTFNMFFA